MKVKIHREADQWRITTNNQAFVVSSINDYGEAKLLSMFSRGVDVYLNIEAICEYDSDEYRACISETNEFWQIDNVACLLRDYVDPDQVGSYVDELMRNATATAFIPFPKG